MLGVRGSTPAPGPDIERYGGHTSCVAVIAPGTAMPRQLMAAGHGNRRQPEHQGPETFPGSNQHSQKQ